MKTKTDAYRKIESQRDTMLAGWQKVTAKDLSCAVYLNELPNGKFSAIGFRRKSLKPAFRHWFPTQERRAEFVANWITQSMGDNEKYSRKARALEVGDVLVASWGYEQTNIDYYIVQELYGKTGVIIAEIGSQRVGTDSMQGKTIPDPSRVIGESMRRVADGNGVKINSHIWARKKEFTEIAGAKIYSADSWTAYH